VPHLSAVLEKLQGPQLATFCKIIAVTITDKEVYNAGPDPDAAALFKATRNTNKVVGFTD
jgi:hypothetical protein